MKSRIYKTKLHNLMFYYGSFNDVIDLILQRISAQKSQVILPTSLNDLVQLEEKKQHKYYRQIDICTTDGMPLVWYFKLLKKTQVERVYGPDLMETIIHRTQTMKHAFYGFDKTIIEKLVKKFSTSTNQSIKYLTLTLPKNNPIHRIKNNEKKLSAFQPNVLWIGIGSPLQVELATKLKKLLPHTTIFCVGAAFEFLSGVKRQAPRWMQKSGLEWTFRLFQEPHRLTKRYLVDIPWFMLRQVTKIKLDK